MVGEWPGPCSRITQIDEGFRVRTASKRVPTTGHEVLGFAVETYNRLIDYARTEKTQFWLNKQRFDEVNPAQSAIGFRATVSAEGARLPGEIRFDPFTNVIKRTVILDVKQKLDGASGRIRHAIHYEDYDTIQDYLDTQSKPRAVLELVANR
jgi:hypothetical protein